MFFVMSSHRSREIAPDYRERDSRFCVIQGDDISPILDELFFAAREGLSPKAYFVGQATQLYRLAYCIAHYG